VDAWLTSCHVRQEHPLHPFRPSRPSAAAAALIAIVVAVVVVPGRVNADVAPEPKVVIIVGPVESSTKSYKIRANEAYAEALLYTSNVVKVYSPNASWKKVKAATVGASLVIYLGHGNGWPSPYVNDAEYTTKDGFGLNRKAGHGNRNVKYRGEPYLPQLQLAPNAIVILNHLCYASGNSEPGRSDPTRKVARKRVDNYGAGFLAIGVAAVIAEGHGSITSYIRDLFTTDASIEDVWRGAWNNHGNELPFASTRTPGATGYTDTDKATSGYYRSLVVRPEGVTAADFRAGAGL
jgi:hypothetical protein